MVLSTDQTVASYWIRAIGLRDCWYSQDIVTAVLKYEGASEGDPQGDPFTYTPGIVRIQATPSRTRPAL